MRSMRNEVMERIKKNRVALLARRRQQYAFARSLGIPSQEAGIISSWGDDRIRAYAEENNKATTA